MLSLRGAPCDEAIHAARAMDRHAAQERLAKTAVTVWMKVLLAPPRDGPVFRAVVIKRASSPIAVALGQGRKAVEADQPIAPPHRVALRLGAHGAHPMSRHECREAGRAEGQVTEHADASLGDRHVAYANATDSQ